MNRTINVVIVEDVQDIRESLRMLVAGMPDYNCGGAYATAEAAIADLHIILPDVILMDINLPGINGVEAVKRIKRDFPDMNILMCTIFQDDENIFQALQAGATGYILKTIPPLKILDAIKEMHEGGAPMSASIARRVIGTFQNNKTTSLPKHAALSEREMEVLQLLAKGLLYKEAASRLNLGVETIRTHCRNIYEKLHVNTKTEAINIVFGNNHLG